MGYPGSAGITEVKVAPGREPGDGPAPQRQGRLVLGGAKDLSTPPSTEARRRRKASLCPSGLATAQPQPPPALRRCTHVGRCLCFSSAFAKAGSVAQRTESSPTAAQDRGGLKAKQPTGQKASLAPSRFFGTESRRRGRHSPPPPATAGSARNIAFHFYPLVYRLGSAGAGNRRRDLPGLTAAARRTPSGPGSESELRETLNSRGGKGSEGLPRTLPAAGGRAAPSPSLPQGLSLCLAG